MDRGIAQLMDPETVYLRSAEREIRRAQAQQIQQILTYVNRVENRSTGEDGSSHLTHAPLPPGAPEAAARRNQEALCERRVCVSSVQRTCSRAGC